MTKILVSTLSSCCGEGFGFFIAGVKVLASRISRRD